MSARLLRNVTMVSASAGTGKTYTLTEKIVQEIATGTPAERIMATTFTKKAAGELRERIAARLLDAEGAAPSPVLAAASQQLGASLIGTVNSVCGQLLAEYAIDAGLSPALEVIGEDQLEAMFRLATDEIRARHAEELNPIAVRLGTHPDLAQGYGVESWEETLQRIVNLARANQLDANAVRGCADPSWAGFRGFLDPPGEDHRADWFHELHTLRAELDRTVARGVHEDGSAANLTTKSFQENHPKVLDRIARAQSVEATPWEVWRGFLGSGAPAPLKKIFGPLRDRIAAELLSNPALHADLEGYVRGLFHCAADSLEAYEQFKRDNALMDFVDQEAKVLDLARHNRAFRESFRGRIDVLVVDEFQDTSPLQLALFLELGALVRRAVWVGDPKQAIYEFRGTDPELMEAVMAQVPPERREQLSHTWRSRQAVVDLSNAVFERVFADHGMARESVHLELPPARAAAFGADPGGVEAWTRPASRAEDRLRATAAGVKDLLGRRPELKPCDVAVLARTNGEVRAVAAALDALGLRASLDPRALGGAREVQLTRAGMAYVADRYDTVALAELVALHPEHPSHLTWQRELLGSVVPREQVRNDEGQMIAGPRLVHDAWRDAPLVAALDTLREQAVAATPTEVLEAVTGVLGLPGLIAGWSAPERRLRNLDAFRGAVELYYERCRALREPATLRGFLDFFASDEHESAENSGPDVVNVLTYHRAKGLEWPVVVMESLDREAKARPFGTGVEQTRELDLADPLAGRWIRLWPSPFPYGGSALDQRAQQSEAAARFLAREQRNQARLMYVGMTRAAHTTVLTAKNGSPGLLNDLGIEGLVTWKAGEHPADGPVTVCRETAVPARLACLQPAEPEADDGEWSPRFLDPPAAGAGAVRLPARLKASEVPVEGLKAEIREAAVLGSPLAAHGSEDWGAVGSAVHAYLGTEFRTLDPAGRARLAERLVERWGVARTIDASLLTSAGERFEAWLDAEFPGWARHREAAIGWRPDGQTMEGWIDLLLEGPAGFVLVDHKTYPGHDPAGHIRAHYLGQMDTYRRAVEAATGRPVVRVLMHLPALGRVYEVA
ncbi:ATP-dependent exoDNAse (exonuclease V) beta subunit [Sinomonas atrocyanea]|uniref:UvrD-helicase domain-containing protein n=1 Tax=Sinomonas atrocyanea TaxID=37927 RepID=UPI0027820DE0|nr:UvrD-helicase domain-containing protein [Sinomonas atrocyanea]MDP9883158.1 ATP-dependent exoDNAse (exonuclease V) beta subunit [Sinomonas atrocyanea]